MKISLDQPAENPFWFREYFLMPMPIGKKAVNLRELLQALRKIRDYLTLMILRENPTKRIMEL